MNWSKNYINKCLTRCRNNSFLSFGSSSLLYSKSEQKMAFIELYYNHRHVLLDFFVCLFHIHFTIRHNAFIRTKKLEELWQNIFKIHLKE